MNVFEEHQLFIPIINDSRFAHALRAHCHAKLRPRFNKSAYDTIRVIARENNLTVGLEQIENVQQALWDYNTQMLEEEYNRQEARAGTFDAICPRTTASRPFAITGVADHAINPCNKIPTPPKEEPIVAKTPAFETKHFVDGQDASTITDEGLIHAIKRLETEIEALRQVKTKSTKISAKIEELNTQREAIAKLLDSRP